MIPRVLRSLGALAEVVKGFYTSPDIEDPRQQKAPAEAGAFLSAKSYE